MRLTALCFTKSGAGKHKEPDTTYYSGYGNYFWDILFRTGLTPHRIDPLEYATVLHYGIGLTNIAPHRIGMDRVLRKTDFDPGGLRVKIEQFAPRVLAFNGKQAAQEFYGKQVAYGRQPGTLGETTVFVLPSTSGAARAFWDERWWWEVAGFVKLAVRGGLEHLRRQRFKPLARESQVH